MLFLFLGYRGDGYYCDDVYECEDEKYTCHANGHCVNTQGSYTCECNTGFSPKKCLEKTDLICGIFLGTVVLENCLYSFSRKHFI